MIIKRVRHPLNKDDGGKMRVRLWGILLMCVLILPGCPKWDDNRPTIKTNRSHGDADVSSSDASASDSVVEDDSAAEVALSLSLSANGPVSFRVSRQGTFSSPVEVGEDETGRIVLGTAESTTVQLTAQDQAVTVQLDIEQEGNMLRFEGEGLDEPVETSDGVSIDILSKSSITIEVAPVELAEDSE